MRAVHSVLEALPTWLLCCSTRFVNVRGRSRYHDGLDENEITMRGDVLYGAFAEREAS
jgi:hypothetical protein